MFRSRLEARWACLFDLLSWKWDYEPLELQGYIPDFVLRGTGCPEMLVECKPCLSLTDKTFPQAQLKIEKSGWQEDACVVGARPLGFVSAYTADLDAPEIRIWRPLEILRHSGDWVMFPEGAIGALGDPMHNAWLVHLWREAGNRTQWKRRS